ncbi:MAG: hypothetical protein ACTSQZ_05190 [Candidatus Thorarchaeota archaeon]
MSDRNNSIMACIVAFVIVCGVIIGGIFLLGQMDFNWNNNSNLNPELSEHKFTFNETSILIGPSVTLDIDLDVGGVNVFFENDYTLIYRIDIIISNDTYTTHGTPSVEYSSNVIHFSYPVANVNVTLGCGTYYDIDADIDVGSIEINAESFGNLGNVVADVSVGSIQFIFGDGANFATNNTIDLTVDVGSIDVILGLSSDIGGSFTGSIDTGDIDIISFGWTEISETHYETSNFLTASDIVTIDAQVGTGSLLAVIQQ